MPFISAYPDCLPLTLRCRLITFFKQRRLQAPGQFVMP
jgi:hypothetical protein